MNPKLYVLIRSDLSSAQQAVQACHAVAEFILCNGHEPQVKEWAERHKTIVMLNVKHEDDLYEWRDKCFYEGVPHVTFIEPDIGNQMTALAVLPGDKLKSLRRLPLALKGFCPCNA